VRSCGSPGHHTGNRLGIPAEDFRGNDTHHVKGTTGFGSGTETSINDRGAANGLDTMNDAEDVLFGQFCRGACNQAPHRVGYQDHSTFRDELAIGMVVVLENILDALDQALGGVSITFQPVVAAGPYRIVVIIQARDFVVCQGRTIAASNLVPALERIRRQRVAVLALLPLWVLQGFGQFPDWHQPGRQSLGAAFVLIVQSFLEGQQDLPVAVPMQFSPATAAGFILIQRIGGFGQFDLSSAVNLAVTGCKSPLALETELSEPAQPLPKPRTCPIRRAPNGRPLLIMFRRRPQITPHDPRHEDHRDHVPFGQDAQRSRGEAFGAEDGVEDGVAVLVEAHHEAARRLGVDRDVGKIGHGGSGFGQGLGVIDRGFMSVSLTMLPEAPSAALLPSSRSAPSASWTV
jgi:hypothetical protein